MFSTSVSSIFELHSIRCYCNSTLRDSSNSSDNDDNYTTTIITLSYPIAIFYCTILSVMYVISLYIFVPYRIQQLLHRDHPIHIQYRSIVTIYYCIIILIIYQPILCTIHCPSSYNNNKLVSFLYNIIVQNIRDVVAVVIPNLDTTTTTNDTKQSFVSLVSLVVVSTIRIIIQVVVHIGILYFGVLVQQFTLIYIIIRRNNNNNSNNNYHSNNNATSVLYEIFHTWWRWYIYPVYESIMYKKYSNYENNDSDINTMKHIEQQEQRRWIVIRNLFIAPITEEIIFRSCMIPLFVAVFYHHHNKQLQQEQEQVPLVPSSFHYNHKYNNNNNNNNDYNDYNTMINTICWITPLFFGFAHVHHAIIKIRQHYQQQQQQNKKKVDTNDTTTNTSTSPPPPPPTTTTTTTTISSIILVTIFQFMYTSIFGTYVSYVYLRTKSIIAVIICHSICNGMGLPDISYLSNNSILYPYRLLLLSTLILGIIGFFYILLYN